MPVLQSIDVEMDLGQPICDMTDDPILDMTGEPILDMDWAQVTDVLADPIVIKRGNTSGLPFARVADTGTMSLALDNSANNSVGKVGYYSPDSPNLRSNFKKGKKVRINLQRTGKPAYYKFQGKILDINPTPGLLNRKSTQVTVVDWMDVASRTPLPRIAALANQRDDQAAQALLNAMVELPYETSFAVGAYTYGYVFTDLQDEVDKCVAALQSLADSGLGAFVIRGGETSGEILTYLDIYSITDPTNQALINLNNSFMALPSLGRHAYKRVKRVRSTVYPLQIDSSPVVLYSLPQSISLTPGQSATFTIYYRDTSSSKQRIAVTSVLDLVADTDFKFSSIDGSGNDLNGSLAVTLDKGGNSLGLTVTNISAGTTGYLWSMQVRGLGVYRTSSVTNIAEDDTISESEAVTLDLKLPYQSDYHVASDISIATLGWLSPEVTDVPTVELGANAAQDVFDAVIEGEPGDMIEVMDDVSGIDYLFVILGYELTINFIGDIRCRWYLAYAVVTTPLLTLDVDGMSELDTDAAMLAF